MMTITQTTTTINNSPATDTAAMNDDESAHAHVTSSLYMHSLSGNGNTHRSLINIHLQFRS